MKKLFTIIITGALILSLNTFSVSADPQTNPYIDNEIISEYVDTNLVSVGISNNGTRLTLETMILPKSQSTSVSGKIYLEQKIGSYWFAVTSWSISGTGMMGVSRYYTGTSNQSYRTRVHLSVGSDNIYAMSNSVTIN